MASFINTKGMKFEKWKKERIKYLGASEISAALGLNPYRNGLDVWKEKTKDPTYKPFTGNSFTKWGSRLEASIAWGFSKDYKLKIRKDNKLRIHNNGILSCSLDRLIIKGNSVGALEIKNMSQKQFNRLVQDVNNISMMYYSQVQQQFFVSGFDWGYFAILVGGNTLIAKKTKADKKFIKMQSELGVEWWNDYVVKKKPPEFDRMKYKALKDLLFKSDHWKEFNFTPDIPDYVETDPVKIFIREIEAVGNRNDLKNLIARKGGIITKARRENQSLINTVIRIKHLSLR